MPVRIVQSKQNARLKELRRALAHPPQNGRSPVGIEGPKLIEEALRAKLAIECVFVAHGSENLLENLGLPSDTEILSLPKELLVSALTTETPQPVAALVQPPIRTSEHILGSRGSVPLVVVLTGLQDPGNLGTILRSAEAFGATGVISLPGTVSQWNPKAVRASAGSVFRMPVLATSAEECFALLREARVSIFTTAIDGAKVASDVRLDGPAALLIGNEGNGVPPEIAAQADAAITIPCPGPVESLNAAVAASVLLYEASVQRAHHASKSKSRSKQ